MFWYWWMDLWIFIGIFVIILLCGLHLAALAFPPIPLDFLWMGPVPLHVHSNGFCYLWAFGMLSVNLSIIWILSGCSMDIIFWTDWWFGIIYIGYDIGNWHHVLYSWIDYWLIGSWKILLMNWLCDVDEIYYYLVFLYVAGSNWICWWMFNGLYWWVMVRLRMSAWWMDLGLSSFWIMLCDHGE